MYCNHVEADTAVIAKAFRCKKKEVKIASIDTDIMIIILLVHHHFKNAGISVYYQYQNNQDSIVDMDRLIEAMNEDMDESLCTLCEDGYTTAAHLFAISFPVAGCDILCSPRQFSHSKIIELCISKQAHLFARDDGLQHLISPLNNSGVNAYVILVILMYKKLYSHATEESPEALLENTDLEATINKVRINTKHHTNTGQNHSKALKILRFLAFSLWSYL